MLRDGVGNNLRYLSSNGLAYALLRALEVDYVAKNGESGVPLPGRDDPVPVALRPLAIRGAKPFLRLHHDIHPCGNLVDGICVVLAWRPSQENGFENKRGQPSYVQRQKS